MKTKDSKTVRNRKNHSVLEGVVVVCLNLLLILGAFYMYTLYSSVYQVRLKEENIGNIANLNRSAATNAISLIRSWSIKLDDIALDAGQHENMTYLEALDLISQTNSSESRIFELIGSDYTGYLAKKTDGQYPPVSYKSSSYEPLHKCFDDIDDNAYGDIRFTPEFTDNGPEAVKLFAVYKHIPLINENGEREIYTLLLAASSKDMLASFNNQNDFEGQATVLTDAYGNYIVSNQNFKSSNFFQYLYVYNDLTLDQKTAIQAEMAEKKRGEIFYKNADYIVSDCVYCYEEIEQNGWYSITCVPLSSFRTPVFNTKYIIYTVVLTCLVFIVDIIWLQAMNRRLRVSMRHEKEANAAKGNFMSRMSHEIRTPLNAVIGYNIIARNEMSDAKTDTERKQAEMKVLDCLSKSDIASKHLLSVINDVLDMSAIENGKIKIAHDVFDFRGMMTSLTTVFYSQARSKGVDFEVVFATPSDEWFIGDQMRVNQILTNLLSNAVKFTSDGGKVTLTVEQHENDDGKASICFTVSDTGIGMTEDYLSHIWAPFEQADSSISRRFGGTGLGLSITKNLVDLLGGDISVESAPGEGTTFTVRLRFDKSDRTDNVSSFDFSNINALAVDDDTATCDYIRTLFARCGAHCTTVLSGANAVEAVKASQKNGKPYNICLVDWRMPDMDGLETITKIRSIVGDNLPIIVLTAYDYSELADDALKIGVDRFISKPLFQSSLFDFLANVCGQPPDLKIEKVEKYVFSNTHVLLAEDNEMNMEIAKKLMEEVGITVDGALNGKEAVDMFIASEENTYSAILMDVHMPVMDGYEATRTIRQSNHPQAKTIPIIAMTADAFAENVAEALASGMNDHISKPIDVNILFERLKHYTS